MTSTYEQYQKLCSDYEKHPEQGLKAYQKRLLREPTNIIYRLAQIWLLWKAQKFIEAVESCQHLDSVKAEAWQDGFIAELQHLQAQCLTALGKKTNTAGKFILVLWGTTLNSANGARMLEVADSMFRSGFRDGYWDIIQLVFKRMEKTYPGEVGYYWCWIAATELYAKTTPSTEAKQATLFHMLALRSLQNAVQQSKASGAPANSPKVTSASQLRLITTIYMHRKMYNELLEVYDNEDFGIDSSVGKRDTEFYRNKVHALQAAKEWQKLHDFCSTSLRNCFDTEDDAHALKAQGAWANDWLIWKHLVTSAMQLDERTRSETLVFIDGLHVRLPTHRNITLAKYSIRQDPSNFVIENISAKTFIDDFKALAATTKAYYELSMLAYDAYLTDSENTIMLANSFKLYYLLNISERVANVSAAQSLEAHQDFFRAIMESSISRHSSDIHLLAVMLLVRCSSKVTKSEAAEETQSAAFLIQAASLIRSAKAKYPQDHRVVLLSSRVHQILGASSLARGDVQKLRLKEVQWESLSHIAFTRIATTHPCPSTDRIGATLNAEYNDPGVGTQFALRWEPHASKSLLNFRYGDLASFPYDKMEEFYNFKTSISQSFTQYLLQIERRRIQNLLDQPLTTNFQPQFLLEKLADLRDFSPPLNCESIDGRQLEEALFTGAVPTQQWLAEMTLHDSVYSMLHSKTPAREHSDMQIAFEQAKKPTPAESSQPFTLSETQANAIWDVLLRITVYIYVGPEEKLASSDIETDMESLKCGLESHKLSPRQHGNLPHWSYLHDRLTFIEVLRACAKLVTYTSDTIQKQKTHHASKHVSPSFLKNLLIVVEKGFTTIQNEAKGMKQGLTPEWIEMEARKGQTGAVLMKFDEQGVTAHTRKICASAHDALDNVLKIQLRKKR